LRAGSAGWATRSGSARPPPSGSCAWACTCTTRTSVASSKLTPSRGDAATPMPTSTVTQ